MTLNQYLGELKNVKLLAGEEEQALWQAFKDTDDLDARRRLIESYQPLVFKVAMRWRLEESVLMDLVQEGTVGLIEAVENYDHTRGVAFSLYATHRIRGRILNYLNKEKSPALVHMESPLAAGEADDSGTFGDLLVDASAEVAAQAEQSYLVEQLKHAMGRLPVKEQLVLSGMYLDETEPKELAVNMDMSVSHIYRLQKQGIRRLRGMLARLMGSW
ncbi:MAG TPA: sigma-70 family RNA polymerase sigma factor [Methylomusa anaerophila]|uniref:RNA polymerase sigma factor FliA n=1 Tax=Methylomusa anaerophila TaxID=1930071 RepID=A0A348AKF3_9FIRM|nr:sigma-70 family RNA polymerase sigma factor [Methylomusa anaerophila]BBB91551.1 RNA polymerase sigma factor FliA [Methylomusa anaerophila]HML89511.1 sigma-70 family RNA polymerase sigma factor [Methylomusa anaerophila]